MSGADSAAAGRVRGMRDETRRDETNGGRIPVRMSPPPSAVFACRSLLQVSRLSQIDIIVLDAVVE